MASYSSEENQRSTLCWHTSIEQALTEQQPRTRRNWPGRARSERGLKVTIDNGLDLRTPEFPGKIAITRAAITCGLVIAEWDRGEQLQHFVPIYQSCAKRISSDRSVSQTCRPFSRYAALVCTIARQVVVSGLLKLDRPPFLGRSAPRTTLASVLLASYPPPSGPILCETGVERLRQTVYNAGGEHHVLCGTNSLSSAWTWSWPLSRSRPHPPLDAALPVDLLCPTRSPAAASYRCGWLERSR